MSECIFCKIAAGELPATKVYEDENYLAFKDIAPKAPHHYLVIPKIHSDRLDTLADDEAALGALFAAAIRTARATKLHDYRLAVNVGKAAGQIVFHTHVHLLAGWHNEPGDMV
jgi:histidine triad (HIT) family protein